jgi:hypothetical protein
MVTILGVGDALECDRGKVLVIRHFGNPVIKQSGDRRKDDLDGTLS